MVSRRNFLTITIMFVILLFMFQFTGVMKEKLSQYGTNEYEESAKTSSSRADMFCADKSEQTSANGSVIYVGSSRAAAATVEWWCTYTKRNFSTQETIAQLQVARENTHLPDVLVIDGASIHTQEDIAKLTAAAERGINLIVSGLWDAAEIQKSEALKKLLGIRQVQAEQTTLAGLHLFSGFLLGGEAIYQTDEKQEEWQDMELTIPWYIAGEGTKSYLVGILNDETANESRQPAVIWRNSYKNAYVFCVNGSYLEEHAGIGILDAMMAQTSSYELYPIINAQNFVVANYPGFADENEAKMQKQYSQTQKAVFREIIWPSLVAVARRIDAKMTCMMTPQFDYADVNEPQSGEAAYYLKLVKEEYGEAGLTSFRVSDTLFEEKFNRDALIWEQEAANYQFLSVYLKEEEIKQAAAVPALAAVRTITVSDSETNTEPIVSYVTEDMTLQRATSDGVNHTFSDDFRQKCIQTALGYSNIVWDLLPAAYPMQEEDAWENLSKKAASNICTYQKPFAAFEGTTLSVSDQRIRRFLALSYETKQKENIISLDMKGFETEAWFLLHTANSGIKTVSGGSYQEMEDGVYLLWVEEEHVEIELNGKEEHQLFYYED